MLDVQVNAVTPDVIREVSGRFGIVPRAFTQLGRSQNLVLGITDEAILKLTDANYRSLSDLEAEAEFVRFLSDKGFSVCAAKPSAGGHLFETVRANGQTFYASVQKRAKGCAVRRKDASAYNMDLFRLLGVTMGRMHAAMRDFRPAHPRFAYDTDPAVQGGDLLIEARCGKAVANRYRTLGRSIRALPRDASCYSMVHYDLHYGNYYLDGDRLSMFDFDDCCYAHFMGDLIVGVYAHLDAVMDSCDPARIEREAFLFLRPFLDGYRSAFPIDPHLLAQFDLFFRHRISLILLFLVKAFEPGDAEAAEGIEEYSRILLADRFFTFDPALL